RHLVPGLVHLAAVDALDREHVEDDRVEADRHLAGGDPEQRDPAAVGHVREHAPERVGVAGHLESDVEALRHPELALDVVQLALAHVDRERRAHPPGELEPVGVHVGHDDVARTRMADDRARHAPDRPRARDQHVLAEHGERERRVDGVPERVEDRRDLLVDARPVVPDVRHRQRDVLGERARPLDAEPDRVCAEVPPAGQAVPAAAADDMALAADEIADREVADVRAELDDLADELVADDHRHRDRPLRPRVPAVDVEVGATDAGLVDADQDVVDSELRLRDLLEPEALGRPGLDERSHAAATLHLVRFKRLQARCNRPRRLSGRHGRLAEGVLTMQLTNIIHGKRAACLVAGGLGLAAFSTTHAAHAQTFTVTSGLDSGNNTLRAAVAAANASPGADTISFGIGGNGLHVITLTSGPLPQLTGPVTIDAQTEPGFVSAPIVELRNGTGMSSLTGL